jgi:hypothetical protein
VRHASPQGATVGVAVGVLVVTPVAVASVAAPVGVIVAGGIDVGVADGLGVAPVADDGGIYAAAGIAGGLVVEDEVPPVSDACWSCACPGDAGGANRAMPDKITNKTARVNNRLTSWLAIGLPLNSPRRMVENAKSR